MKAISRFQGHTRGNGRGEGTAGLRLTGTAGLRLTVTAGLRPTTVTANLTLDPRVRAFARARSRCLAETPETLPGPIVPATAQPLLTVPPRTAAPARVSLLRDVKRNTVLPLAHV